jgi:hypothetical protein
MSRPLPVRALRPQSPEHRAEWASSAFDPELTQKWKEQGRLVEETGPALYGLELPGARGGVLRLLLCAFEEEDTVPLERGSTPLSEGQLVPALAVDDHQVLRDLLAEAASQSEVEPGAPTPWPIPDGALLRRIRSALEAVPVRPLRALKGRSICAVAPLSDPALAFLPIHRGVKGLPHFQPERFLAIVREYARIYELEDRLDTPAGLASAREQLAALATGHHAVLLVLPNGDGRILRFRQALELTQIRAAPKSPTLRSLDLALLDALVLRTVLGIAEPESLEEPRLERVDRLAALIDRVNRGELQAGFALNPPPLWELRAVIEAGESLPPRTMRLLPEPPSGLRFGAK